MFKIFLLFCLSSGLLFADYIKDFQDFDLNIVPIKADKSVYNKNDVPFFSAEYLDGRKFSNTDIKGATILVFWAVGCSACKEPMIELSKLDDKIEKHKLKVKIISVSSDPSQQIMAYFSTNKINLAAIVDNNSSLHKSFGAMVTPLFYLIDKKGYVRGIIPGAIKVGSDSFWKLLEYLGK